MKSVPICLILAGYFTLLLASPTPFKKDSDKDILNFTENDVVLESLTPNMIKKRLNDKDILEKAKELVEKVKMSEHESEVEKQQKANGGKGTKTTLQQDQIENEIEMKIDEAENRIGDEVNHIENHVQISDDTSIVTHNEKATGRRKTDSTKTHKKFAAFSCLYIMQIFLVVGYLFIINF